MIFLRLSLLILISNLVLSKGFAFVENVTHGYTNCISCHVSPGGGGVLTFYGRSLSKELMSTWGWEGSEEPLFGALKQNENFLIGGDVRAIQTHIENRQIKRGQFFLMQQNIELAYKWGKNWLVGTFGTQEGPDSIQNKGQFVSERHFVLSEFSESLYLRAGKFRVPFGIYDPNHTRVTKGPLGFGSNSEAYNLEAFIFSEENELFVGTSLGRMDIPREQNSEKSFYFTYATYIKNKNKAGVSYLVGESPFKRRNALSTFGIFSLSEHTTMVNELVGEFAHLASSPEDRIDGVYTTHRLLYEAYKGVKPYVIFEARQSDLAQKVTRSIQPGLGIQWLPMPHFEIQAEYQRVMTENSPGNPSDVAWLLTHFYF